MRAPSCSTDAAGRVTGRRQVVDWNQGKLDTALEPLGGARLRRDPREPIAEDLLARRRGGSL